MHLLMVGFMETTHADYAAWNIVQAGDKKRARLNCISHLLGQIPYKELPLEKVTFGKRNTTVKVARHLPRNH